MAGVEVSSAQVARYHDLVKDLTRRYVGRFECEFDDLYQEGNIKVFQALAKGQLPSKEHILNGMRDWVRTMEYQTRYKRMRDISYEEYQESLLEQEKTESLPNGWDKLSGGLDYIDTSESELYS